MPVPKLLLNMGLPMMLSMVSLALYNIVDTFFVSRITDPGPDLLNALGMSGGVIADIGDKAVNALTLAYPIQMLIIALGVGTGIGINTQTAHNLGKKDPKKVSRIAGNAFLIAAAYFILILLFGIFGAESFINSQTSDPVIRELGTRYLQIVAIFSLGTMGHMCIEKVVMSTGRTVATMTAQLSGTIINVVLDPILIYGLLGLPALGIRGAAIATVIGQFASFFIIAFCLIRKCPEVNTGFKYLKPDGDVLKLIFSIAGPAIAMQLCNPAMNYAMNLILGSISVSAVTAFGVYGRLAYFVSMLIFGLNNASIPSASFNRGARDYDRVKKIILWGQLYAAILMAICIIVLQVFARPIVGIFEITETSAALCRTALHIVTCGYFFMGSTLMLQGICQALGKGVRSLITTLIRCIIALLPLAFVLSRLPSAETSVWFAIPAAELIAFIAAVIFTLTAFRKQMSDSSI